MDLNLIHFSYIILHMLKHLLIILYIQDLFITINPGSVIYIDLIFK